jgi:hypothetical protein
MFGYPVSLKPIGGLILSAFLAAATTSCGAAGQSESVEEFATRLIRIVSEGDKSAFAAIDCVPQACDTARDWAFVVGRDDSNSQVQKILSDPKTSFRIYGPYTYDDNRPNGSFAIVFYREGKVAFDSGGRMVPADRKQQWNVNYVETIVTRAERGWSFHRVPFYRAAHLPWMDD